MHKWDSLSKPERAKLLAGAGLPTGLAQLNWSGLQKSERKKLEKGKGWFEAKEPIMTAKGIEPKAPEHYKVAIKKEAGKALNKRMERKEPIASKKPKEEKLFAKQSKALMQHGNKIRGLIDKEHKTCLLFMKPTGYDEANRYKEERQAETALGNRESFDFYYTRPNGQKDKVTLNAENDIFGVKLDFNKWNEGNEATVYKIEPHQTVEEEQAGYKNHPKFNWMKTIKYPLEFPTYTTVFDDEHIPSKTTYWDGESMIHIGFIRDSYGVIQQENDFKDWVIDAKIHPKWGRGLHRIPKESHQPDTPKEAQKPVLKELELLVIEAQKKGLYYLNDIKDYVSTKTGIHKEELGGKIYDILKEQEKDKPNLVEQVMENLKKQEVFVNQSGTQSKYESFLNTMPNMERGKAKKTLNTQINYEGNVMSRREFVEKKAAGGGKVVSRKERMYKKEETIKEKLDVMWKTVPFGNSEYPATKEYNRLKAELEAGIYKDILTIQTSDTEFVEVTKTEADYFNHLTTRER